MHIFKGKSLRVITCILLLFQFSCTRGHNMPGELFVSDRMEVNTEVSQILADQFEEFQKDSLWILNKDTLETGQMIASFFQKNKWTPVWTDNDKLRPQADSLLNVITSLNIYGIKPGWYDGDSIMHMAENISRAEQPTFNVTRIYEMNILLTDLFFRIASNMQDGIINQKTLKKEWKIDKADTTLISLLQSAIVNNTIRTSLESLEPSDSQYTSLKRNLNQYLKAETGPDFSYRELTYQDSIRTCIDKLMVNMERCRWESHEPEDYRIIINIPSNEMEYYSCDTLILKSRVITGKKETPTPFFLNSEIRSFYVYPYWIVPYSIATKEILPKLKKDPGYLHDNNMDVLDLNGKLIDDSLVKWKQYNAKHFPFIIRQRDGDENTLGILKFIFPNRYRIYLHDTNSKNMFNREDRNLSHGCIRLEKALDLAEEISKCCALNFTKDTIAKYVNTKTRKLFTLYNPLPVHIRYYTAKADSTGLHCFPDVYSIDEKIIQSWADTDKHHLVN